MPRRRARAVAKPTTDADVLRLAFAGASAPAKPSAESLYIEARKLLNVAVDTGDWATARQALENLEAVHPLVWWRPQIVIDVKRTK